ncbi:MAG: YebC/PmpR family DNA-binding transcriptional regulator [Planctomycetes bacterium]|nr:YebC/PmpR family DNA-binding transcriptional regulator [Planctomycetota bacterium]
MSGHSHWAGIKHKKAAVDAKRGKLFSKLAKNIISAARSGGGDPAMNLTLKYAIDAAKAANMPKDNIERAIRRGTGEGGGHSIEELVYEGYGPGGVAILVEVLTDNRNRTGTELKTLFHKRGGNLGATGSVAWKFDRKASFTVPTAAVDEDTLMALVLEAGGDDLERYDEVYEITADPVAFDGIRTALEVANLPIESSEVTRVANATVEITEPTTARKVLALMEAIEDHDDVKQAYADFDIADDVLQAAESLED